VKRTAIASVHVGTGGWVYKPWRGAFYPPDLPQKRELEYASSRLTSIEINSTFHGTQKPASFEKWYAGTPAGFIFSVKGPMFATNRRVLAEAGESIDRFFDSGVLLLRDKLGPINWQLGPAKRFDAVDVEAFMAMLPRTLEGRNLSHAIEVRHAGFDVPAFRALAARYGIAIVHAADSKFPTISDSAAPFVYARLMGTSARWKAGYSPAQLKAWAARAQTWARSGREVFIYFISGCKERNPAAAMALISRLSTAGTG